MDPICYRKVAPQLFESKTNVFINVFTMTVGLLFKMKVVANNYHGLLVKTVNSTFYELQSVRVIRENRGT